MKRSFFFWPALGLIVLPAAAHAARAAADLQTPQKRQAVVATAERLAQRSTPPELPADLVSPFDPTAKPEVSDVPPPTPEVAGPPTPPPPAGDREILQAVAAQLSPTGTINYEGTPQLVMGSKRFRVGDRFIVTYNGQDHELELTAIDRTTFTLRYRNEEFTRPIKSVR